MLEDGSPLCPNALQAKIIHPLQILTDHEKAMEKFHPVYYYDLDPLSLRRYFLYLNSHDSSLNTKLYRDGCT
jgi:hypothetical protein